MAARFVMAVVVVGSPLTVTIEGASAVVAAEDFVGSLATDDRVQAAFLGDRLVVLARAGGAAGTDYQLPARLHAGSAEQVITDANSALESGWYQGSGVANAPGTSWYFYEVVKWYGSGYVHQRAMAFFEDRTFERKQAGGTWGAWREIASTAHVNDAVAKLPTAMASGFQATSGTLANGAGINVTVNLTSGRFSTAPNVVVAPRTSSRNNISVTAVSTTSFTVNLSNFSGATAPDTGFQWIAVQN